ncbi:MAG: hypothetical protein R3250_08515, partial [Melioribacteraceae bacterium]|nr:hypothetical protein [Melioribacteraceae bacterium]
MHRLLKIISIFIICFISLSRSEAQLLLHDDFQSKSDQWFWRGDGNQSIPSINKGLLHLHLNNAIDSQYCNTEIYNPDEPYGPGTQVRIRLKTTDIHTGSRGWGFWDGDLNLTALAYDFDVAWVMQQGSLIDDPNFKWFLFGVASDTLINRRTFVLDSLVNETEWQTYKIVWDYNRVAFYINDSFIYETFENLPDQKMRIDVWVDNRVINTANPKNYWNNAVESSEMLVDFIEISSLEGPSINRSLTENIIFWDSPNSFPNGDKDTLWKDYSFSVDHTGETLFFLTGLAESYENMREDILTFQINDDPIEESENLSIRGSKLNGNGKSIVFTKDLSKGIHRLGLYSQNTPFLRDIIILNSERGKTLFIENYDEKSDQSGLWKTINFSSDESDNLTILVSGKALENDGIRFELDGNSYGWDPERSILGDSLNGLPNTIVFDEKIPANDEHKLKIFSKGTPEL